MTSNYNLRIGPRVVVGLQTVRPNDEDYIIYTKKYTGKFTILLIKINLQANSRSYAVNYLREID